MRNSFFDILATDKTENISIKRILHFVLFACAHKTFPTIADALRMCSEILHLYPKIGCLGANAKIKGYKKQHGHKIGVKRTLAIYFTLSITVPFAFENFLICLKICIFKPGNN